VGLLAFVIIRSLRQGKASRETPGATV
jgi:hypothetical protein